MGLGRLLVRADATPQIGTGHVMRCLALAQAWQDHGGQVFFATHECVRGIQEWLTSENIVTREIAASAGSVDDAFESGELIQELNPDWLVVDGFGFTSEYISRLQRWGTRIVLIDDHGNRQCYDTNVVINPNIFATREMYPAKKSETAFLIGLRFALIRREFRRVQRKTQRISSKHNLLVTFGGSDPDNVTLVILEALGKIAANNLEITIVCGAANEHVSELERVVQGLHTQVHLLSNVKNMGEVLANADMAISAPGASASEFAAVGVPMMLVTMAANHARTAEEFASRGLAVSLGWWNRMTVPELAAHIDAFLRDDVGRTRRAALAAQHIDFLGPDRIVNKLTAAKLSAIA